MNTKVSKKKRWKDFSSGQRAAIVALASVQVALAGTAWIDLARRDASEVNGSKGKCRYYCCGLRWSDPVFHSRHSALTCRANSRRSTVSLAHVLIDLA